MHSIVKAASAEIHTLATIGRQTLIESHGHSAPAEDIRNYLDQYYSVAFFEQDLNDERNNYHIIYAQGKPVGYSKLILNKPHPLISEQQVTKLERLYLLKEYHDRKLGAALFNFNLELSRKNNQSGIWLFVWKENARAKRFYEKNGFKPIGTHDFRISETHVNPNHVMYLVY